MFATLLAALVLGDVVRLRRWTAIEIGSLGVMVVLRPELDVPDWFTWLGGTLVFASVLCIAYRAQRPARIHRPLIPYTVDLPITM
jgi:drug/metabolite transporter (DMT)-like permease